MRNSCKDRAPLMKLRPEAPDMASLDGVEQLFDQQMADQPVEEVAELLVAQRKACQTRFAACVLCLFIYLAHTYIQSCLCTLGAPSGDAKLA